MSDRDPLRDAFDQLRARIEPLITAPGIADAVRRRARRRARLGVALFTAGAGVLGLIAIPHAVPTDQHPQPSFTALRTATRPSRSTTAPRTERSSTSVETDGLAATKVADSPPSEMCSPATAVRLDAYPDPHGHFTLIWQPPDAAQELACRGKTVAGFWATYTVDTSYTETLFRYRRFQLSAEQQPIVTQELELPAGCRSWYIVVGDQPIAFTVKATDTPYADAHTMRPSAAAPCQFPTSTATRHD